HDRARKLEPGRFSTAGEMIGPVRYLLWVKRTAQRDIEARPGDIARSGRAATLIGDHAQAVALGGKPQDGLHEVAPMRAVEPGRAHDHVTRIPSADGAFAGKLAAAIGIKRSGRILLYVRSTLTPIEYIIRRNMHERDPAPGGFGRQPRSCLGVD